MRRRVAVLIPLFGSHASLPLPAWSAADQAPPCAGVFFHFRWSTVSAWTLWPWTPEVRELRASRSRQALPLPLRLRPRVTSLYACPLRAMFTLRGWSLVLHQIQNSLCFMTRLFYTTFSRPNASFPFRCVWFSWLFILQLGAELVPRGSLPVLATPAFSSFLYISSVSLVSTPCPSLQPF